jgi:hypothetical protein
LICFDLTFYSQGYRFKTRSTLPICPCTSHAHYHTPSALVTSILTHTIVITNTKKTIRKI